MLGMDLIEERPTLNVEFHICLGANLLATMAMTVEAPQIEGLDQWIYTTHAALPAALKRDVTSVMLLASKSLPHQLQERAGGPEAHADFAGFRAWLAGVPEEEYAALIAEAVEKLRECEMAQGAEGSDPAALLRACYGEELSEAQILAVAELYGDPARFKAQLLDVVTEFWDQFYRQEFERCRHVMERSAAHHRQQNYSGDFVRTFEEVTGRRFPKGYEEHVDTGRVVFVPSCHIGPYVMLRGSRRTVVIHYNARPTGAPERTEDEARPTVHDMFPPLKALADETRLQIMAILNGRELYAQQIVERLDITQSAVSRQLALMVIGGLLDVRKEESMKYYAINEGALAALIEQLKRFRGPDRGPDGSGA